MGLDQQRNCTVLLVVLATVTLNLVFSEAVTLPGRRLLQTQDGANDVARIDPLDHFRKYRGRYDITNKHYWSSTIFTGIYGYGMGLLWLVAGAVYSVFLLRIACCSRNKTGKLKKKVPCQKAQCYLFSVVLATVLTVLVIIASGVALGGTARFHSRAKTIMTEIMDTADQASNAMYNATGPMRKISINLIESGTAEGYEAAHFLATTSDQLSYEATGIERRAQKNRKLADKVLTVMYILTSTTICLNLAAAIALTVFGVLRFRRVVYMLVILCWFLTILCWLFFGTYFFIERFSGDTCTALHDFQRNPDNSSLSTILPCDQLLSARTVMTDVSLGLYEVLNQVNANISVLRANSLPGLSYVCNPFSGPPDFSYKPKDCPADSINIGDVPQVLQMFTCSETSEAKCEEGFISTSEYNDIKSYTSSVQNLLDAYPGMEDLVNCQLVKDAFSDILLKHCKPVKRYIKTACIATLFLSIVMMVLVATWAKMTHQEQHHFRNGSVKPNTLTTDESNADSQAA